MAKNQKNNTAETALVIPTTGSTAEKLDFLNAALKKVKTVESSKWKSSGKIRLATGETLDLKTPANITEAQLIKAYASINARATAYEEACDALYNGNGPLFTEDGASKEDLLHDIKLCAQIKSQKDITDKLVEFKKKLEGFMSEAEKKALAEAEMQDFFSKNKGAFQLGE